MSKPSYRLKVTLQGSKPPIWRRLEVAGSTTLARLHEIIQVSMGWTNSHLHQFEVGGESFSDPEFELDDARSERGTRLNQVASAPKDRFMYEYDFGDGWQHVILVEQIGPPAPGVGYPRCVTGKRACPPEDVGGIWGYAEFLDALRDPEHPEHETMVEWSGGDFDPEAFDVDAVNAALQ